jgi:glutamyl-Q tRNA(Asp) synthetase
MARACARLAGAPIAFLETGTAPGVVTGTVLSEPAEMTQGIGDVVLARKDMGAAYHLAVVVDDAAQAITHVIRGADLFEATRIHVLLQNLLGLSTPIYHHHELIRDDHGKRLAKRDDARAIALYRSEGLTPTALRTMIGL